MKRNNKKIYLPRRPFDLVLKLTDDRIERRQKKYYHKIISIIKQIFKVPLIKITCSSIYYPNRVKNITRHYKQYISLQLNVKKKKILAIKKKLQLKKTVWQFNYLRLIGFNPKDSMNILKKRTLNHNIYLPSLKKLN